MKWYLTVLDEDLEPALERAVLDSLAEAITEAEELFDRAPDQLEWRVITRRGQVETMELRNPPAGQNVLIESEDHTYAADDVPRFPGRSH